MSTWHALRLVAVVTVATLVPAALYLRAGVAVPWGAWLPLALPAWMLVNLATNRPRTAPRGPQGGPDCPATGHGWTCDCGPCAVFWDTAAGTALYRSWQRDHAGEVDQ